MTTPPGITIRHDLKPGDIGYIVYLHGTLYAEEYDFDRTFDAYVAEPLAKFIKTQTERERLWVVEMGDRIVGSIAVVEATAASAQLRWLILHPDTRGAGVGRRLVQYAVDFARGCNYDSIFLWTVDFLDAAVALYKSFGFEKTEAKTHQIWGRDLTEEKFVLDL